MAEQLYTFEELSPLAKDKAIEDLRNADLFDSDWVTEIFKQHLDEKGLPTEKVYWSLGYTQGDGVSFYGAIDVADLLVQNKLKTKYKDIEPYVSFRITGESARFFGPGAMDIEYDILIDEEEFIPDKIRREINRWQSEENQRYEQWAEQSKPRRTGPKEWTPRIRPFVHKPFPKRFLRAEERAKDRLAEVERKAEELREDIKEIVDQTARELARLGYEEIDYHNSEEHLAELAEANDWRFTEDGRWVP